MGVKYWVDFDICSPRILEFSFENETAKMYTGCKQLECLYGHNYSYIPKRIYKDEVHHSEKDALKALHERWSSEVRNLQIQLTQKEEKIRAVEALLHG